MISAYLTDVQLALSANREEWFPMDADRRKDKNHVLGRSVGYGLAIFDEWEDYAKSTYGRFVVRNSLDSVGVAISNKEWMGSIRAGVEKHNQAATTEKEQP